MSKTPMILMDQLLQEADTAGKSKEHVLEQMHYASLNVETAIAEKFDQVVGQVQSDWGAPDQNVAVNLTDHRKAPLPKWLHDAANIAGSSKLMRVAYWKRQQGYSYVMVKVEVDSKDRPTYYNLILGSRRRLSEGAKVGRLRREKPWWAYILPFLWKDEPV